MRYGLCDEHRKAFRDRLNTQEHERQLMGKGKLIERETLTLGQLAMQKRIDRLVMCSRHTAAVSVILGEDTPHFIKANYSLELERRADWDEFDSESWCSQTWHALPDGTQCCVRVIVKT